MLCLRITKKKDNRADEDENISGLISRLTAALNRQAENESSQHHACECCQPTTPEKHWKEYNEERGISYYNRETDFLIAKLPTLEQTKFHRSKMPIIDLGVSCGEQHAQAVKNGRTVIGYENSPTALEGMKKNGILARNIDLSKVENSKLAYRQTLKEDLIKPADIFMVHILEYLPSDVAIKLIYALMKHAKPGSTFYIQSFHAIRREDDMVNFITLNRANYYASFFAARTDMKTVYHNSESVSGYNHVEKELHIVKKL